MHQTFQGHLTASTAALTGLRGFAAMWVLTYHAWVFAGPKALWIPLPGGVRWEFHMLFSIGWAGVPILFVLSAFLLTLPYARHYCDPERHRKPALARYLRKRLARVMPAYYAQLLFYLFVGGSVGLLVVRQFDGAGVVNLLIMNFYPTPIGLGDAGLLNDVWWTLPIELSFYLVLPLIAGLARWRNLPLLCASIVLVPMAWRYWVMANIEASDLVGWFSLLPGSWDSFGCGMLAAVALARLEKVQALSGRFADGWRLPVLTASTALILALIMWMDTDYLAYRKPSLISYSWNLLFSFATAAIIFVYAASTRRSYVFAHPLMVYLGLVSYGLYLWHYPVGRIAIAAGWFDRGGDAYIFPQLWLVMTCIGLLLATLSWYVIEAPATKLAHSRKGAPQKR